MVCVGGIAGPSFLSHYVWIHCKLCRNFGTLLCFDRGSRNVYDYHHAQSKDSDVPFTIIISKALYAHLLVFATVNENGVKRPVAGKCSVQSAWPEPVLGPNTTDGQMTPLPFFMEIHRIHIANSKVGRSCRQCGPRPYTNHSPSPPAPTHAASLLVRHHRTD
jgi:hypothetical protein